jgi:AMP phosphorylase
MLDREFKKLFKKFNIHCETIKRVVTGPDGRGIGPNMEIREALKLLERDEGRCLELEGVFIDMASRLFESTKTVKRGEGKKFAQEILNSGKALDKFWEIAFAQGATRKIKSSEIKSANLEYDLLSDRNGIVKTLDNTQLISIAKALGNPKIKEAGMYMHKVQGDEVSKGDPLITLYATTEGRLAGAKEMLDIDKLYTFK